MQSGVCSKITALKVSETVPRQFHQTLQVLSRSIEAIAPFYVASVGAVAAQRTHASCASRTGGDGPGVSGGGGGGGGAGTVERLRHSARLKPIQQ